ncbi:MAG TPA: efflux RND transporter permease subunit [Spirochaetota bacterium]|nr:efflux RND transporter permease subunit [Spirochaetota bacterium]HPR47052.1 efflux RND transporter permease subunit [Spirochaetota bacterium]
MNSIIDFIIKRYRFCLVIILLISVPLGYYTLEHRFFNHIDIFFNQDDPDLLYYKRFQERYGNEELAVIVFRQKNIFTAENIDIIRRISDSAKNTAGIQRVYSLSLHEKAVGKDDTITYEKLIPEKNLSEKDIETIRKKALADDIIVDSLVSPDGRTTAILIELEPIKDNEKKRAILIDIMSRSRSIAAEKKEGERVDLKFAGVPYVEVEMNYLSQKDFFTFIPIVFTIIFLIVFVLLREISLTILCQMNLFLCLIWAIGFFVLCGETFNMATIVMGPVILAISVADSIHILSHFRKIRMNAAGSHVSAVGIATKSIWLPCLLTSLTTGVGFFSFITGSIRPVKILGIFTASGVMFAFVLTITFLPSALLLFHKIIERDEKAKIPEATSNRKDISGLLLEKFGNATIAYRKIIMLIMAVVFALSLVGLTKIQFETNFMNYLPDNSEIRKDINFIEENMGGTIPFVMLIHATDENHSFNTAAGLSVVETVQNDLMKKIGQFSTSFSLADYFKEMNQAFNNGNKKYFAIPEKDRDIADYYEIGDPDVLGRLVSADRMEARISFQSKWDSNETANDIYLFIVDYMKKNLGDNYTYKITGLSSLYLDMEYNLKQSQRNSFTLAFIIIFAMMYLVCRNLKLTVISMTVNLFPIALTMGIMGWFKIPLDISTVMIASVTIGIAVDDTIHFVTWYRRNRKHGMDVNPAIVHTYRDVGKPIVITSVVLFLGFFILVLGAIKPTRAFGLLTALAMIFALAGDIILLPALISIFKPRVD